MMKALRILLSVSLVAMAASLAQAATVAPSPAPAWTLNDTDGNAVNFSQFKGKVVVVDFWATWCGPCRAVAPIVEEIAEEYDGRAVIGKLDVDSNRDTAMKYGIQAIPTLFLVKDGEIADKIVGNVADKNNIKAKLDALL